MGRTTGFLETFTHKVYSFDVGTKSGALIISAWSVPNHTVSKSERRPLYSSQFGGEE